MENQNEKNEVTEEDKLIFSYLIERQSQLDTYYDAQNSKISQILAINGVIFGIIAVVIDKILGGNPLGILIIAFGSVMLFLSVIWGILAFKSLKYDMGFPVKQKDLEAIIYANDNISSTNRLNRLKSFLINSLYHNEKALNEKVNYCDLALLFEYIGIILLFIGYCILNVRLP